jgi:hypothetical protein
MSWAEPTTPVPGAVPAMAAAAIPTTNAAVKMVFFISVHSFGFGGTTIQQQYFLTGPPETDRNWCFFYNALSPHLMCLSCLSISIPLNILLDFS